MGLVQLFVDNLENTTAYDATIMANAASAFETSATGDSAAVGNSRCPGALPKIARARLRPARNLRIAENPDRYVLPRASCLGDMPYDMRGDGAGKHAFRRAGREPYRLDHPFGRHGNRRVRDIPDNNLPALQKRRQVVLVVPKCQRSAKGTRLMALVCPSATGTPLPLAPLCHLPSSDAIRRVPLAPRLSGRSQALSVQVRLVLQYSAYCHILRIALYGNTQEKRASMSRVASARSAGSIVRRFRESQGLSRATLSRETGIGARTIYALAQGASRNFGLENYLKLLDALGPVSYTHLDVYKRQVYMAPMYYPCEAHAAHLRPSACQVPLYVDNIYTSLTYMLSTYK